MENKKDNPMTTNPIPPKVKKLRNMRNILWIVFVAITITILLIFGLTLPAAMLINKTTNFSILFGGETGLILLTTLALVVAKIGVSGIILLVIYYIFKYRLEKEDDLFL